MYIKYYVISTPVERDGIDARGNQERVTSLSMNYNAIQIDGKNENLSVIDKSDASCSKDKVLVIGLGQLGLPVAKYVKDRGGFDTYGYDISTKATDRAQKIAGIKRIGDNSTGNDGISSKIITIMPHMILLNLMSLSSVFLHTNQMTCFLHKLMVYYL